MRHIRQFREVDRPGRLAGIELLAGQLECKFSGGARPINLDPGYLDSANLVLATTKSRDHGICIGQGIFAEVTLRSRGKSCREISW